MEHLKGEIYLSLTNSKMSLQKQDYENTKLLQKQLEETSESFINLYNYNIKPIEKTSKLKQIIKLLTKNQEITTTSTFSLLTIEETENSEGLIKYIKSVLDKMFPKYPESQKFSYKIFGIYLDQFEPYEYSVGFRPISDNSSPLSFNVEYLGRNQNQYMTIKISWDFKPCDYPPNKVLSDENFAHEILYTISETPFLKYSFFFNRKESYSSYTKYNELIKLQLIAYHLAADPVKLNEEMNNMVELVEDIGALIPIEEVNDFLNYDGYGYLCKEINGVIYNSYIVPDMDYELPDIYKNYFTHIYWYNR